MRLLIIPLFFIIPAGLAQQLIYSPGQILEKTVDLGYYNTEYVFISKATDISLPLDFELIYSDYPAAWSVTGCTNLNCYTKVPDSGTLGDPQENQPAYISINLSVNQTPGEGMLRFLISSATDSLLSDTLTFVYHTSEDLPQSPKPWAQISFNQENLTVFIENPTTQAQLELYDIRGNQVEKLTLTQITSIPLSGLARGTYIVRIREENKRELAQLIVLY